MTDDGLARALGIDLAPTWGSRGKYRCPTCGSVNIARERLVTTYYPAPVAVHVERSIRCVDCGTEDTEDED